MSSAVKGVGMIKRVLKEKEVAESTQFALAQEVDRGYRKSVSRWRKVV
jgi:hypothetical protein